MAKYLNQLPGAAVNPYAGASSSSHVPGASYSTKTLPDASNHSNVASVHQTHHWKQKVHYRSYH